MSTMKVITKREALDRFIKDRLMGSIPPAYSNEGKCMYSKSVNGGCALGVFIPKSLYSATMENYSAKSLFKNFPKLQKRFESPDDLFWCKLQRAHDSRDYNEVETRLRECAELC